MAEPDIDGALVGGASLDADEFVASADWANSSSAKGCRLLERRPFSHAQSNRVWSGKFGIFLALWRGLQCPVVSKAIHHRRASLGLLSGLLVLATAACNTADASNGPQPPKSGGTLRVVASALPTHLDPQRIASATEANVSRLTTRTLTTFRSEPGTAASEIVGDLATDTGRPSDNNKTWDFKLKDDLRWEDGSPLTCADVKYGVERSFSSLLSVSQIYAKTYLAGTDDYEGPFVGGNNNGKGLASVQCVDQRNIRFTLSKPIGDFGYTVAMSVFAPVPAKQDTKTAYDKRPFSSGPYKFDQVTDKQITFVRNQYWDRRTDQVRKAYPDKIVISSNEDLPTVTSNLIESDGEWADTVDLDKNIAPNFVQQVINDPDLSARAIQGSYSNIRYLAINTKRITNPDCRKALIYAFDKRKFRSALGGAVFGDFATTMISPSLKAHKDFDLYDSAANIEGKPDVALKLMENARTSGKPCPATITIAIPDLKDVRRLIATVIETYQQIGIQLKINALDPATYLDKVGNPANGNDLALGRVGRRLGQRLRGHPAALRRPAHPHQGQRDQQPGLFAAQRPANQRPDLAGAGGIGPRSPIPALGRARREDPSPGGHHPDPLPQGPADGRHQHPRRLHPPAVRPARPQRPGSRQITKFSIYDSGPPGARPLLPPDIGAPRLPGPR